MSNFFYSEEKISQNFNNTEFECNCGCMQNHIKMQLVIMAESFRAYLKGKYKKEIRINVHCVNRCVEHNKNVGGLPASNHIEGDAMDLHSPDLSWPELKESALECHGKRGILWGGLGLYSNWNNQGIHIDLGFFRRWGY